MVTHKKAKQLLDRFRHQVTDIRTETHTQPVAQAEPLHAVGLITLKVFYSCFVETVADVDCV